MNGKSIFILLCITCLSCALTAQSSRFSVGVDFYPNLSINFGEERRSGKQIGKLSNTIGFTVAYRLNRKLALESGLQYINKGERTVVEKANLVFSNSFVFFLKDNESVTFRYNYNYLGVPLNIRLSLGEDLNKGWYLKAGATAAHYHSTKIRIEHDKMNGEKNYFQYTDEDDIRKTHLNVSYGLGYAFLIKEKYQLNVEPMFEYMLYKLYHKNEVEERYYSFGLHLQIMIL